MTIPRLVYKLALDNDVTFSHCDPRVLHAPSTCRYCDNHPERQIERLLCGVAFTGQAPDGVTSWATCPADFAVEVGERGRVDTWPGNSATIGELPGTTVEWIDPTEDRPLFFSPEPYAWSKPKRSPWQKLKDWWMGW